MLLSDRDIKAEIESGRVKLDPYEPELIQPSSIDVRLDRYFRVFENHRYPHIDPAVEQPDLTRLVETEGEDPFVLHPNEFVLASTHSFHGGLDRPGVLRPRDARVVQRGHPAHQAVARNEDRPAVPVPDQFAR